MLHRNACVGNVERKLKGLFLDTALLLQVVTLGTLMCRNGDGIVIAPEIEEWRIHGGNIHPFHDFRLTMCRTVKEVSLCIQRCERWGVNWGTKRW